MLNGPWTQLKLMVRWRKLPYSLALLATSAADKGLKIFDVQSFDMIHWIKLGYTPGPCEWIGGSSSSRSLLACADAEVRVRVRDRVGSPG